MAEIAAVGEQAELKFFTSTRSLEMLSTIADGDSEADDQPCIPGTSEDEEETQSLGDWWQELEEECSPIRRLTEFDCSGVTKVSSLQNDSCPQTSVDPTACEENQLVAQVKRSHPTKDQWAS